jgi:hypothetical protein
MVEELNFHVFNGGKPRNIISYLRVILARTSKTNQQSGKIFTSGSTVLDSKMFNCKTGHGFTFQKQSG